MTSKIVKIMGKKRGMVQLFDSGGAAVACTVIEAEPNVVTQIKTVEKDGYTAVQTAFDTVVVNDPRTLDRRVSKPLRGHFAKADVEPRRHLQETRVDEVEGFELKQTVGVQDYANVSYIDVTATSKGKGFQGLMKRNHYSGGPASHGSGFHRHAGSRGCRTTPGRRAPGQPEASQMGNKRVTVQNLKIFSVDAENNIIIVEGAVPGPTNALVTIAPAVKRGLGSRLAK